MEVQFAVNSYQARALPLSAQRCVNYFAEAAPKDAKSDIVLYNAPGIKAFGSSGLVGAVRGAIYMGGVLYIVAGNTFYSVTSLGVATAIGVINTTSGTVSMDANRASPQEVGFVDGTNGWTYDTSNGLRQISDGDFAAAGTIAFQDGYFIFSKVSSSEFFISALNDGQTIDALDFADAEGNPDEVVAVFSDHRELWVFGEVSTDVYFNSGNADFPFERINGAFIERGLAAAFAVAADDNTIFWLGDDGVVYKANGYVPQRISTHAIENAIQGYSSISDATAYFVTIAGHKMLHLTFPTGNACFVFDVATGLWHERESYGQSHWRGGSVYVRAYGKDIIGDAFQGKLGELDMDHFTEYGSTMQGILVSGVVHGDRKRVFHRRLEIDVEAGVGLTSGQGSDPQIWLDYSDDGGRSYSLRKPQRSLGKIGEYQARLRWNRLGQARNRVYRLTIADPVKRTLIGTHLDAAPGHN